MQIALLIQLRHLLQFHHPVNRGRRHPLKPHHRRTHVSQPLYNLTCFGMAPIDFSPYSMSSFISLCTNVPICRSATNANATFYEIITPPFICHLVGAFPCFVTNQSISLRAMLILLGIDGKWSAVNQPASSISISSREISPPA